MKVASLNINGGRSCVRRLEVLQMFTKEKKSIFSCYKRHTPTNRVRTSGAGFLKVAFFFSSAFEDAKAGVAIIVHPRVQPSEISCRVVCKGFLVAVELISSNQKICIVHVYCPSSPFAILMSSIADLAIVYSTKF